MDLTELYERLYRCFGPQHWWPAETDFEVIVGAVLTQNTNWNNVERAISNLKDGELTPEAVLDMDGKELRSKIRCTGFYNQKAERLKRISRVIVDEGGVKEFLSRSSLRERLLDIKGIGPETADSIVLYAAEEPSFVVDAYTKRILKRVYDVEGDYDEIKSLFEEELEGGVEMYQEYHALLVELGKKYCRSKPLCAECVLKNLCSKYGRKGAFSTS